jgi:adenosylcobinamide-phosphate synthase
MDFDGCRRAAIESLAENFVDGFLSPLFWYVIWGLPALLLYKVASTMDSMVGYKTPQYLRFGWCGARLDDLMNYVPARLAWIFLGTAALFLPGASPIKAWQIGFQQHSRVPGPNAGWSEATMAGLLQRRLVGPIQKDGAFVTCKWIGEPTDPAGGKDQDIVLAIRAVITASLLSICVALTTIFWL